MAGDCEVLGVYLKQVYSMLACIAAATLEVAVQNRTSANKVL